MLEKRKENKEINEAFFSLQEEYNINDEEFKDAFFSLKINRSAWYDIKANHLLYT